MSHLYDKGYRGSKISKHITGVKQTMVLHAQQTQIFNDPIIKQAIKSGRYTNSELKQSALILKDNHQLPFTLDMLDMLEATHWTCGRDKWERSECDKKAIYLAVAIAFDTGRRISNLTHPENGQEDHCLRWENVHMCLKPCDKIMNIGHSFKQYFNDRKYGLNNVESIKLYFTTQNQSHIQSIVSVQPIIINRQCSRSSGLVDKIIQWSLVNSNSESEEFLTRNFKGDKDVGVSATAECFS
jgi:hypothetical protein